MVGRLDGRAAGPPAAASGHNATAHLSTSSERTAFKERRLQEQAPHPVGRLDGRAAGPPAAASGHNATAHLSTSSERTAFKERRLQEQAPYPVGRRKVGRLVLQPPRQATTPALCARPERSPSLLTVALAGASARPKSTAREKKWPTPVTTRALSHRSPLKPLPSPPHPSPCLHHSCPLPLGIHRPAPPGMPPLPPPGTAARQHRQRPSRKRSPSTDPPNQHNHHP
jgi:hypothetical protein